MSTINKILELKKTIENAHQGIEDSEKLLLKEVTEWLPWPLPQRYGPRGSDDLCIIAYLTEEIEFGFREGWDIRRWVDTFKLTYEELDDLSKVRPIVLDSIKWAKEKFCAACRLRERDEGIF